MNANGLLLEGEPAGASVHYRTKPRHRILVVDDDKDICLLYTNALARPGCRVDTTKDAGAGWEALQANRYNLLIAEHCLPGLSGVELVRKLRAARMDVPVVLTTVRLPAQALVEDPALQLAALLPKPFYISQLLETVQAALLDAGRSPKQTALLPAWRSWPSLVRRQANGVFLI